MNAPSTILLLVDHDPTRERLVDQFGGEFDVATPSGDDLPAFDLCLADRAGLQAHRDTVDDLKREAGAVFLPVLLVCDERHDDYAEWELTLVDGVEPMPVEDDQLESHVSTLLERRERTLAAADETRQELHEREAFAEAAFEALPDLFYVFDVDGELQRWNGRAPEITGYEASELEEMHTLDFLPESDHDRVAAQIVQALEGDHSRTVEVPLVTRDGEQIPYEFRVAPMHGPDGAVVGGVGIGRDITDRQMRRELVRQNERLEKFASIVSHDLRNPIAIASGFLELTREDCDSPHLDRVDDAIGRMEALIEDLLALARQGKVVDETERVPLDAAATDAWGTIETRSATLDLQTAVEVLADRSRLRQLLENLFRNSVEHGGDAVTVTVGTTSDGFFVADDGSGIPPDEREGVFEYGHTTSDEGTGFGLAIVREIADAHGWSVSVTESESGGARFEFAGVERPVLDD